MSANNKFLRKRFFVDQKVQGALVAKLLLYWATCLITIAMMLVCWRIATSQPQSFYTLLSDMWFFYGPPAIASLLLLPIVIMDLIRISNRFVGPLIRLRRSMRALARGENVKPIEFREGDFWQDFADEFNAVRDRIMLLSADNKAEREDEELLSVGI